MRSPESSGEPIGWVPKLLVAGFGTILGLVLVAVALEVFLRKNDGTQFQSFDDIRRAMMKPGDSEPAASDLPPGGSVSLRGIVSPHPDNKIIYTLRPHLDLRFVRARVRTNSCGMRGPERLPEKPANTYRIALLGDSFAFGWGVEQNETFAQVLENTLNTITKGSPRVEVLNFGVPGYSTFQEVGLFEERALDFQPDAVLVYFVQNDFGMPFFVRDLSGSGGILSSLEFVNIGRKLLDPQSMDRQIRAMGLDPNTALEKLTALTRERGIPVYLAVNPRKAWRMDLSQLGVTRKNPDIRVMNLREPLMRIVEQRRIDEKALTLTFDPHPSPLRHRILGEIMASYFLGEVS